MGHKRARHGKHLPLTATQVACFFFLFLFKDGKYIEYLLKIRVFDQISTHFKVLHDGQGGKYVLCLRHKTHTLPHKFKWLCTFNVLSLKKYPPGTWLDQSEDGL